MSGQRRARHALRRYLEQRREFGEDELTLDTLDVDQVLRLVGALGASAESGEARSSRPGGTGIGRHLASADYGVSAAAAPTRRDDPSPQRAPEREVRELPATADWREALRAAGAAPSQVGEPRGTRSDENREQAGNESGAAPAELDRPDPDAESGRRRLSVAAELVSDAETNTLPRKKLASKSAAESPEWVGSRAEPKERKGGSVPSVVSLDDVPVGIEIPDSSITRGDPTIAKLRSIEAIASEVEVCRRCKLYKTATHGVPGEGNPNADFVCVGEAPGANEDATGRPFVGQAGQLLTKILAAINLSREDVFICNVLKHRPPGNRNPLPEEVEACSPFLLRQLALLKPRVIVAFGTFAAQTLLETKLPLGKLRGQVHRFHGVPLVVTYHPAALLRNSAWKRPTWEDVQLARRLLDRPGSS